MSLCLRCLRVGGRNLVARNSPAANKNSTTRSDFNDFDARTQIRSLGHSCHHSLALQHPSNFTTLTSSIQHPVFGTDLSSECVAGRNSTPNLRCGCCHHHQLLLNAPQSPTDHLALLHPASGQQPTPQSSKLQTAALAPNLAIRCLSTRIRHLLSCRSDAWTSRYRPHICTLAVRPGHHAENSIQPAPTDGKQKSSLRPVGCTRLLTLGKQT